MCCVQDATFARNELTWVYLGKQQGSNTDARLPLLLCSASRVRHDRESSTQSVSRTDCTCSRMRCALASSWGMIHAWYHNALEQTRPAELDASFWTLGHIHSATN